MLDLGVNCGEELLFRESDSWPAEALSEKCVSYIMHRWDVVYLVDGLYIDSMSTFLLVGGLGERDTEEKDELTLWTRLPERSLSYEWRVYAIYHARYRWSI